MGIASREWYRLTESYSMIKPFERGQFYDADVTKSSKLCHVWVAAT